MSERLDTQKIVGSVEWFVYDEDGYRREDPCCARCGVDCEFVPCWNCNGDGEIEDDDGINGVEYYRCDWCRGKRGSWRCTNTPAYCKANPQPGREHIESTAMNAEAWLEI